MEGTSINHVEFTAVSHPVFNNAENTAIGCEVKFTHFDHVLPFNAVKDDTVEHGRLIYQYCLEGNAGKIAPFVAPQVDLVAAASRRKEDLSATAEGRIAVLQRAARLKMATDAELTSLDEWERYSVLLERADPATAPDITWPVAPL